MFLSESFDDTSTVSHIFNSTSINGSNSAVSIGATGRNGTNGLTVKSDVNIVAGNAASATKTLPSVVSTIYAAFSFRTDRLPNGGTFFTLFSVNDAGAVQCNVILMSDGTIRVRRATTTLGTVSGFSMLTGVFYHFEIKLVISSTVGVVQFWVNEVLGLNLSSQNTQGAGTTNISEFSLVCAGSANQSAVTTFLFDDVVVRDDAQSGDVQVKALLPTGTVGGQDQWTANGAATTRECVDDSAPNDDTDYASTANVGDKSIWTYPNIPATSTIVAVNPKPRAKKTDAGTAKFKSLWYNGSAAFLGTEKAPSNGSYERHPDPWLTNPDTAVAWTPTDWNTAGNGVGIERTA